MPEITPDPLDRLARFTPDAAVDPAEILFRAGRASARTPAEWKLAVVGLLLANAATAGLWIGRRHPPAPPMPAPVVIPVVIPVVVPAPNPETPPPSAGPVSPWSAGALNRMIHAGVLPPPEPAHDLVPAARPLTVLAARSGAID